MIDYYAEAYRMLATADAMLREGVADPVQLVKLAPIATARVARAMAMLRDPRAGNKLLRVPNLTSITIGAGATSPVDGNSTEINWPNDGRVLGIRVGTAAGTDTANSQTSVKIIRQNGDTNLFTDGQKDAFMPFAAINTVASPYWPLWIKVRCNEKWDVTPRNEALGAGAPVTVFPFISFAFCPGKFLDDDQ